jgi:hypothetical protein
MRAFEAHLTILAPTLQRGMLWVLSLAFQGGAARGRAWRMENRKNRVGGWELDGEYWAVARGAVCGIQ